MDEISKATLLVALLLMFVGFGACLIVRGLSRLRGGPCRWSESLPLVLAGIAIVGVILLTRADALLAALVLRVPDTEGLHAALVVLGSLAFGVFQADYIAARLLPGTVTLLARVFPPIRHGETFRSVISVVLTLAVGATVATGAALTMGIGEQRIERDVEQQAQRRLRREQREQQEELLRQALAGQRETSRATAADGPGREVPFVRRVVDAAPPLQAHVKAIGDISGDGLPDIAVGGAGEGYGLYWYEYPDWRKHEIVPPGKGFSSDMVIADIDNDGDGDIVVPQGASRGDAVFWYENPSGAGDPREAAWTEHSIGAAPAHDLEVADLDGNGLLDVVVRDSGLMLFLQTGDNDWQAVDLGSHPTEGTAVADIDLDGDPDIVVGGHWLENPLPSRAVNGSWSRYPIDASWPYEAATVVADINLDGRPDVLLAPSEIELGKLSWFESPVDPRAATAWEEHVIDANAEFLHQFVVEDFDLDGYPDVATAEMHQASPPRNVSVYYNLGGGDAWSVHVLAATGAHNLQAGDIGRDGDIDLVGVNWHGETPLELWENEIDASLGALTHWDRHVLDESYPDRAVFVTHADLNGDNLRDIVAGSSWWENPGSLDASWLRHTIGAPMNQMAAVEDLDGDGDLDVFGTRGFGSAPSSEFAWAENDGTGQFQVHTNIERGVGTFLQGVAVARFRGPIEIALSWQLAEGGIQMLTVPENPARDVWQWRTVSNTSLGEGLDSGDIDGDGDLDLSAGFVWFRNDSDGWTEFTAHTPAVGIVDRVHLTDMDADGDLDALVGYGHDPEGKLAWYENGDDPTEPWTEHLMDYLFNPQSVDFADLDGDGDVDVVAGEHRLASENPEIAALYAFENLDGAANVWRKYVIHVGDEHHDGAQLADFDNDGDLDIVSIGWNHRRLHLYENRDVLSSWKRREIDAERLSQAVFVRHGDLDRDGWVDVAAGAVWYRNPGEAGGPWLRSAFGAPLNDVAALVDLDRDGDLDAFGSQASGEDDNPALAWARNDGAGNFTVLENIAPGEGNFLQGVTPVAAAGDGPIEIAISWQDRTAGTQLLTVPGDPSAEVWQRERISEFSEGEDVSAGDIDRDGDIDLMLGSVWLERVSANSWREHAVTSRPLEGGPDRNRLADINADGRLDVVVGASREGRAGEIVWYAQPADATGVWTEHVIADDIIGGGMSLDVADIDADGDIDITVGEHDLDVDAHATLRTLVIENVDGAGVRWRLHKVHTGDEHHDGNQLVDIDNDGDKDIVSVGWSNDHVVLYENTGP